MQLIRIILISSALFMAVGCAPDEGEVCDHVMNIMKDDPEKPGFLESSDRCIERMENVQKRFGVNSYRREVECFNAATTSYKIRTCIKKENKRGRKTPKI